MIFYKNIKVIFVLYTGSSPDLSNRPEIVDNMVKTLQSKVAQAAEKVSVLQEFQLYVREGDALYVKRNFKYVSTNLAHFIRQFNSSDLTNFWYFRKVLKVLLDSLSNDGKVIQVEVLQTLIDMLKCQELIENFSSYNELLVLKVIYAYKSDDQKVDSSSGSGGRSPVSIDCYN